MFENGGEDELEPRGPSSDRYGIMEKLKRLQEGEDLDELLAEMDEEFPVNSESEEDEDLYGLTEVQKRTLNPEKLFVEQERRDRQVNDRKKDLNVMREKLMMGTTDAAMDQLGDLRNASANKIKKTKVVCCYINSIITFNINHIRTCPIPLNILNNRTFNHYRSM